MVGGRRTDASANPKHLHKHNAGVGCGDAAGEDASNNVDACGGSAVGHAGDRLSALPDDLLHAIMSRLKALQMVRTCVQSTRWRHLWRAVPCLHVDEEEAGDNIDNFTSNLLRSHDIALLEDLRLQVFSYIYMTSDRWVRRAIGQGEALPCRLKRLHLLGLSDLRLTDLGSHISSRCPALEDVLLRCCSILLTSNVKIVSSPLKKLAIVVRGWLLHGA